MVRWGVALRASCTGRPAAPRPPWLGPLFTADADVRALLVPVLVVAAVAQPLAGIVFVLDGVLIGAGDAVFLAWAQLASLALFAPAGAGRPRRRTPSRAGLAVGGLRLRCSWAPGRSTLLVRAPGRPLDAPRSLAPWPSLRWRTWHSSGRPR